MSKAVQLVIDAIGSENISGAINSFTSQFSVIGGAIATIVGGAKEVISTGVDAINGAFSGIADALPTGALDSLKAAFETIAPAVAAAVGAFALMLPVVAGIAKIAAAAGGIKALGAALAAVAGGPVGLAIAGIVAVVAALAALYNTNEDVKNAVDGAWQKIQELSRLRAISSAASSSRCGLTSSRPSPRRWRRRGSSSRRPGR